MIAVVPEEPRYDDALAGLPLTVVVNPEPAEGISGSIRIGIRTLPDDTPAVLIAVADQPYLTSDALADLIRAFVPGRIVVPRYGTQRGNPPIFDRRFFPELLALDGDRGGQRVLNAHPEAALEIDLAAGMGADIDRPDDWQG